MTSPQESYNRARRVAKLLRAIRYLELVPEGSSPVQIRALVESSAFWSIASEEAEIREPSMATRMAVVAHLIVEAESLTPAST